MCSNEANVREYAHVFTQDMRISISRWIERSCVPADGQNRTAVTTSYNVHQVYLKYTGINI